VPVTLELPRFLVFVCNHDPDIIILLLINYVKYLSRSFFYRLSGILNTKNVAKKNRQSVQRLLFFGSQYFEYQHCCGIVLQSGGPSLAVTLCSRCHLGRLRA